MKKIFVFAALLIAAVTFSSCDEDIIEDYNPVTLEIFAEDADGNNLFDPSYDKNIIDEVTVTYNGEVMKLKRPDAAKSKINLDYFMPSWYGATLRSYKDGSGTKVYYMYIGQWDATKKWNEELQINWPDGTYNTIRFKLVTPGINHCLYLLDGKSQRESTFKFVK